MGCASEGSWPQGSRGLWRWHFCRDPRWEQHGGVVVGVLEADKRSIGRVVLVSLGPRGRLALASARTQVRSCSQGAMKERPSQSSPCACDGVHLPSGGNSRHCMPSVPWTPVSWLPT